MCRTVSLAETKFAPVCRCIEMCKCLPCIILFLRTVSDRVFVFFEWPKLWPMGAVDIHVLWFTWLGSVPCGVQRTKQLLMLTAFAKG